MRAFRLGDMMLQRLTLFVSILFLLVAAPLTFAAERGATARSLHELEVAQNGFRAGQIPLLGPDLSEYRDLVSKTQLGRESTALNNPLDGITWWVSTTGSDGTGDGSEGNPFGTIQHGIDLASTGDDVYVLPGTYSGFGNRDIVFGGKEIELIGYTTSSPIVIDCSSGDDSSHSGFIVQDGETSALIIRFFTIINAGQKTHGTGHAVYISGSSPKITDCSFEDCRGTVPWGGGAVKCVNSSAQFESCSFKNNCYFEVGAIEVSGASSVTFDYCCFLPPDCQAVVLVDGGLATFEYCTFVGTGALLSDNGKIQLNKCLLAFGNTNFGAQCVGSGTIAAYCCDIYGNPGGDWVGCLAGQDGVDGNFSADPLFCDTSSGDYYLDAASPCAPWNNSCGVYNGANMAYCGQLDPRVPDTIRVGCPIGVPTPYPDSIGVPVYIWADDTTMAIGLCLACDCPYLSFSSFDTSGTVVPALPGLFWSTQVDTASNKLAFLVFDLLGSTIDSPAGLLGTVYMKVDPATPEDVICNLDSTMFPPIGRTLIGVYHVDSGSSYVIFAPTVADCGSEEIIFGDYVCGDADGNEAVNISDVVYIMSFIQGTGSAPVPLLAGDADGCSQVNIADVAYLLRYIFGGGPPPCAQPPVCELPPANNSVTLGCPIEIEAPISDSIIEVPVYATNDVALGGFSLGFLYQSASIDVTNIDFTGSITPTFPQRFFKLDPDANRVLVGWVDFSVSNSLQPQSGGLLFTMQLHVPGGMSAESLDLDSIFVDPGGEFIFVPASGGYLTPAYSDCGAADIVIYEEIDSILLDQEVLCFTMREGDSAPSSQSITISSSGDPGSVSFEIQESCVWLDVSPESGSDPADITFSIADATLGPGIYSTQVSVVDVATANSPVQIDVTLFVEEGVNVGETYTEPGSIVSVPIWLYHTEPIDAFTIPLRYYTDQPELVRLDTVILSAALDDGNTNVIIEPDSQFIIVLRPIQPPPTPDSIGVAELIFTIDELATDELVRLDTATIDFTRQIYTYQFVRSSGETVVPQFSRGWIVIGDPAVCGDVNTDGAANVTDAVYLIQYIFAGGPPPETSACADVNTDGFVNITDVIYLIQFVFADGTPPCDPENWGPKLRTRPFN
ncbi:MAG: dockerin type I domain-containing protein [bacterium]